MNTLRTFCLVACLVATICASPNLRHTNNKGLKPTEWLSPSKLQSLPSVDGVSWQQLENMPVQKGAEWMQHLYHLSQINHDISPSFVPSASNIPTYIVMPNGQNISTTLNQLVAKAKQQQNFGDQEVTILITGMPQQIHTVAKATQKLVQAYQQRYNGQQQHHQQQQNQHNGQEQSGENIAQSSSEEDNTDQHNQGASNAQPGGNLIVINLGATLNTFKRFAMLDVEKTGDMIGKVIVQLTNQADVPQEIVHIIAQGIAAHVAGAAGRQYMRLTGHQLRRITALDPSQIFAKNPNTMSGLARGDAQFVDAIHTSAHGMGTPSRVGDVDFYPNGPSTQVPGAANIIEASMRATRYFAETVMPGNERHFPAVAARSLEEYKNNDGYGKRAYMGINTEYDVEGDYILEVNANAPFGKSAPAQKQNTYHGVHQTWNKNTHSNSQDYQ